MLDKPPLRFADESGFQDNGRLSEALKRRGRACGGLANAGKYGLIAVLSSGWRSGAQPIQQIRKRT